ncbi:hypothetical protein CV102_18290 [Natronococcus pandeyae]|uniref:Uncharacterized protein n=1 Tax=Natronococcus pandeyae TaxID=2055836 RepID=A0A8J8Q1I2_9EURY|nr:hypothetical protein [Natronococcus pandeyae]TYL37257.1 hypothetical protein CV102_18290 [Natronococcus pandeyae]
MGHQIKEARALVVLLAFIASTGIAAAQENEINSSLTEIEQFVATTLGQIGVIVFLIGAAAWFVSRKNASRAQWGWRGMWGGAGMIILSVSYNVFVTLFEDLAPGLLLPWIPL